MVVLPCSLSRRKGGREQRCQKWSSFDCENTRKRGSVRLLLTEDRHTTLQMIADRLNIGKETVHRIVTEDLGKRKICARFVPHALTTEQKQERVFTARIFF